jgi:hypothetical protein
MSIIGEVSDLFFHINKEIHRSIFIIKTQITSEHLCVQTVAQKAIPVIRLSNVEHSA